MRKISCLIDLSSASSLLTSFDLFVLHRRKSKTRRVFKLNLCEFTLISCLKLIAQKLLHLTPSSGLKPVVSWATNLTMCHKKFASLINLQFFNTFGLFSHKTHKDLFFSSSLFSRKRGRLKTLFYDHHEMCRKLITFQWRFLWSLTRHRSPVNDDLFIHQFSFRCNWKIHQLR